MVTEIVIIQPLSEKRTHELKKELFDINNMLTMSLTDEQKIALVKQSQIIYGNLWATGMIPGPAC